MSIYGPFSIRPGILQRSTHLIDLIVRNDPSASAYRLWVSRTLNDAYGTMTGSGLTGSGGLNIMDAKSKKLVASPTIIRKGWAGIAEVRRDQTSFMFDVNDYIVPIPPNLPEVPSDEEYLFARIQEQRGPSGWLAVPPLAPNNADMPYMGPILVVPPPTFYGRAAGVISLAGLAPAGSDCEAGFAPVFDTTMQKPLPMHITMPFPMASVTVRNTSADKTLLVSFGMGCL